MSKKKIRKPKKRDSVQRKNQVITATDDIILTNSTNGKQRSAAWLIAHEDELTSQDDLQMLASLYDNPNLPYFNRMKADRIFIKLDKLGDLEASKYHGIELYMQDCYQEAIPFLLKALPRKDFETYYYLGLSYYWLEDYQQSLRYFKEGADLGDAACAYNTFIYYYQNRKYKDNALAHKYLNLAYEKGSPESLEYVWQLNFYRPLTKRNEAVALKALKQGLADEEYDAFPELKYTYIVSDLSDRQFFELLSLIEEPDQEAMEYLADCYMFGIGTAPDVHKAIMCYRQLIDDQMSKLMIKYIDEEHPYESLIEAAKSNKACCYYAGRMALKGTYGKADPKLAERLLKKGISKRYFKSQYTLAHLYLYNEEYENIPEAIRLLEEDIGYNLQCYNIDRLKDLYTIYKFGLGVEVNEKKAKEYADLAMPYLYGQDL